MAIEQSNDSPLEAAEKKLWGAMADAQSLMAFYPDCKEFEAWFYLSGSLMERLIQSVDEYSTMLVRHREKAVDGALPHVDA